jgi:hypothetical protein
VQKGDGVGERLELPPAPEPTARFVGTKTLALLASCVCALTLAVIFFRVRLQPFPPIPKVVDSFQITKDGLRKADAAYMLVSEGTRLYFQVGSLDDTEHNTALVEVSANGGETARIPVPFQNPIAFDFSQTHSELLLGEGEFGSHRWPLWVLPLPAGPPHRVGDILALDACWSADRRGLAFTRGKEVFVAEANGSEERKLATADDFDEASWIRFSPDGKRLRFSVVKWAADKSEVMEVASDGTGLHRLAIQGGCCGTWSADGKYYFY